MKTTRLIATFLVGVTLAFTAATLSASDPVGVYAIVQKVIFEPNDKAPERIQIWGVFALADTSRPGNNYTKPQLGYMYFSLPKGRESVALKEWADFKAVAGTGQGVAFGTRYSTPLGKVHPDSEKPGTAQAYSPDSYYANGIGVSKVNPATGYQDNMNDIVSQLKTALK
ncbi:MAG TPA: hypothetical protein VFO86_04725 [Terriglobia bacterium]|nr:hypothetical protein [Terriglobia bacterium]